MQYLYDVVIASAPLRTGAAAAPRATRYSPLFFHSMHMTPLLVIRRKYLCQK